MIQRDVSHLSPTTLFESAILEHLPTSLMISLSPSRATCRTHQHQIFRAWPEFTDNHDYHQGPAETHGHVPIVISLIFRWRDNLNICLSPTFLEEWESYDTGNLTETGSVFFGYFHGFLFCFPNLFLVCSEIHSLLSRPAKPSKHIPSSRIRPIFKNVRVTLCPFLLSFILLPNRRLPTEIPTLGTHILLLLILDFTL